MDFLEFVISSFTQILRSFVPGYISVYLYRYLRTTKADTFEKTAIHSVVISYILTLFVGFCCKGYLDKGLMTEGDTAFLTIVLGGIVGAVCAVLRNRAFAKKSLEKIGRITGSESIWEDLFDVERGSKIRCTAKFHNKDVSIQGDVKYFEPVGDGECNIVLEDYQVKNLENNQLYKPDEESRMRLNTKNISSIEVTYGANKRKKAEENRNEDSSEVVKT